MKKIFFIFSSFAFLANVSAQLTVNSTGKIGIGPISSVSNTVTLSLYGIGSYGADSKLSFGDIGSGTYPYVFIGEYPGDSDQLWLHGKNGILLSKGDYTVAFTSVGEGFFFTTKVYAPQFIVNSDARFKSNIAQIQTPLEKLLSLNGVSYDFDYTPAREKLQEKFRKDNSSSLSTENDIFLTEKEKTEQVNSENRDSVPQIETRMGFIAQELQKIFPDLVKEDEMGFLAIDYIGLIPVIVEAMKEQQIQIEKLKEQNKQLVKLINIKSIDEKIFEENGIKSIPLLLQNTPNPFNQATEIGYYIPQNVSSANIYIYDINGFQQKNISISERGKGATTMQASVLQAGIYFYTLICDGKPVDTKQMILTR